MYRVGLGYDVHQLVENRKLILGGVEFDYPKGLLGHSDADVLVHAINDALLGAAGLRDIGYHFPDNDLQYKGISSIILMERTLELIKEKGYIVNNVDATVVCEEPKIKNFVPQMVKNIAKVLEVEEDRINIKGTTTEKLGFEGRREGISSYAICSIIKK